MACLLHHLTIRADTYYTFGWTYYRVPNFAHTAACCHLLQVGRQWVTLAFLCMCIHLHWQFGWDGLVLPTLFPGMLIVENNMPPPYSSFPSPHTPPPPLPTTPHTFPLLPLMFSSSLSTPTVSLSLLSPPLLSLSPSLLNSNILAFCCMGTPDVAGTFCFVCCAFGLLYLPNPMPPSCYVVAIPPSISCTFDLFGALTTFPPVLIPVDGGELLTFIYHWTLYRAYYGC